ncbi:UDP-N-acetylglucosamine 2-epimerase (non-hydrolyzing) [Priestia aryabhattai]|uniref:non-hydrolyzing UDP-N-acetylglucosamine 2-epimerase n=1 Tax=Priestia aryabhattai TaxID=412384 RepID=UPI00398257D5
MKVLTVVGARPQFIKACMLSRLFNNGSEIEEILVHTGQHYDSNMSDVFFKQLQIPKPNYHLGVGSDSHGRQTGKMLIEIENIILAENPDIVLVYGDTNSTLAGSLVASKLHVPIAHVEAGLRSFNKKMPEEVNRLLTDHLSTWLFCPTADSIKNLKCEGIEKGVYLTGDIMYDATLHYRNIAIKHSDILSQLKVSPRDYYLATIHRAENTDNPNKLKGLLTALGELDKSVVLPLHPRTKNKIEFYNLQKLLSSSNIRVVEPLDYFDMLALESAAKIILTDSGGVQKEAYMLEVPCITLRDETEWTETVQAGWNTLTNSLDYKTILKAVSDIKTPNNHPLLFGDGATANKIYNILLAYKP